MREEKQGRLSRGAGRTEAQERGGVVELVSGSARAGVRVTGQGRKGKLGWAAWGGRPHWPLGLG